MTHQTNPENAKGPSPSTATGPFDNSSTDLDFATGTRHGKAISSQITNAPGWRGSLAAGNPEFRKYGAYDQMESGRRVRRTMARMLAKAVKNGGRK